MASKASCLTACLKLNRHLELWLLVTFEADLLLRGKRERPNDAWQWRFRVVRSLPFDVHLCAIKGSLHDSERGVDNWEVTYAFLIPRMLFRAPERIPHWCLHWKRLQIW